MSQEGKRHHVVIVGGGFGGLKAAKAMRLPTHTVLWAAGTKASPIGKVLAERTGAALDRVRRVIVEPDPSISDHPNLFEIFRYGATIIYQSSLMNKIGWISWMLILATILQTGCKTVSSPESVPITMTIGRPVNSVTQTPTATIALTSPTNIPATVTPLPEPTPMETAVPTPSSTPNPLFPHTISGFRQRDFLGGQIQIQAVLEQNDAFTKSYIEYPSDGLSITGLMFTPAGEGPFPTLILLHGYIDRARYFAGADTWQAAEFFARHGYLVLAPDLRSWGESDAGLSLFHMGLVADVLNLISSLSSVPESDTSQIGLWGHSMGGGLVTKVLTIDDRVQAAILYAPNSADDADLIARWGTGCLPGQSEASGDHCNPAEVIPGDTPPEILAAYPNAAADPLFLRQVAPYYHLENITAPVQIHIGTADGQSLTETPTEWSAKLAEALLAAQKEVDYFTYDGQGHAFTGESWIILLDRARNFFDEQLKQPLD